MIHRTLPARRTCTLREDRSLGFTSHHKARVGCFSGEFCPPPASNKVQFKPNSWLAPAPPPTRSRLLSARPAPLHVGCCRIALTSHASTAIRPSPFLSILSKEASCGLIFLHREHVLSSWFANPSTSASCTCLPATISRQASFSPPSVRVRSRRRGGVGWIVHKALRSRQR